MVRGENPSRPECPDGSPVGPGPALSSQPPPSDAPERMRDRPCGSARLGNRQLEADCAQPPAAAQHGAQRVRALILRRLFALLYRLFPNETYSGTEAAAVSKRLPIPLDTATGLIVALPKPWLTARPNEWPSRRRRLAKDFEKFTRTDRFRPTHHDP